MTDENHAPAVRIAVHSAHRLVREALAACLGARPHLLLVGSTATADDLARLCPLRRPDVIVVETTQVDAVLVASLAAVHAAHPQVGLLVVYAVLAPAVLHAALRAGVTALVPAAQGVDGLLRAIDRHRPPAPPAPDGQALTDRELEVIVLLAAGYSANEMAALLDISPHTVDNHKRHLYAKLEAGSQAAAVARAETLGLVPALTGPGRTADPAAPEAGRDPLVVLAGEPGAVLDEAARAMVMGGLAVAHTRRGDPGGDHWYRWHRGSLVTVLVDPADADWAIADALAGPVVVVFGATPSRSALIAALAHDPHAVLRGDRVRADLPAVLVLVHRGYRTLAAEHLPEVVAHLRGEARTPDLTPREREILLSIARGHTVRQTARALGIAAKTVENIQTRLFRKLGAHNRSGAIHIAYRLGFLTEPEVAGKGAP